MRRELNDYTKKEILSIDEFKAKYGVLKTVPAIGYDMKMNKIDYCQPERDRFIVMTRKTMDYFKIEQL